MARDVLGVRGMVAKCFEDLVCWQLAVELRDRVIALTATSPIAKDRGFCDQIRRAARSIPANIAEGFGRYAPADFARHLSIALGSLNELSTHLGEALAAGAVDTNSHTELTTLVHRTRAATTRLLRYLKSPAARRRRTSRTPGTRTS